MNIFTKTHPTDESLQDFLIAKNNRFHQNVSEVLQYLMSELNMSEGELARRTGVPQPSIHRILSGKTPKPRNDNLEKISNFFGINIDQLLARLPLSEDRVMSSINDSININVKIPVLDWNSISNWLDFNARSSEIKISIDHEVCSKAYALAVDEKRQVFEFKVGTTLIFDPQRLPILNDYVVLSHNEEIYFGELATKEKKYILISGNKTIEVNHESRFLGVLIEFRRTL